MSKIPEKPESLDLTTLFDGIAWHQRWELFKGVHTPGRNPVCQLMEYGGVPEDLTGKRVLDIGAWNGCFSAECVRRGADYVLGLSAEAPEISGFNRIKEALGYDNMEYQCGSVYNLDPDRIGQFDIVLFYGVLYHLRHPLLALDKIYGVCRDELYIESFVIDSHFLAGAKQKPVKLTKLNRNLAQAMIWQFYPDNQLQNDYSNWFGPSVAAMAAAVRSAGFDINHTRVWGDRAAMSARKSSRNYTSSPVYEALPPIASSV